MYLPYGLGSASDPADYELPLTAYRNGTVYPADDYQIPRGQPMGVLDQDGGPVRISGLERYRNILLGEPAANGEPVAFIDEEVIFAGFISHHYGHFLLETLSRLWAYKESELRIVWAAGRNLTEWSHKLLRFLSVPHKRHLILRQPTRFAKIWVPAPGYIIPDHFHYRQKDALATVRGRLGEDKIYLTRQSFTGGFYHIVDDPANPKRAMIVDPAATAALLEERAER